MLQQGAQGKMTSGKLIFLGTGNPEGIPVPFCSCSVCSGGKIQRLRSSVLIQWNEKNFVIDVGPDFRQQMLLQKIMHLDGVFLTHPHYDHIGGIDDLRAWYVVHQQTLPVVLSASTHKCLCKIRGHLVQPPNEYETLAAVLDFTVLSAYHGSHCFLGLPYTYVSYYQKLCQVTGYRIGNIAYLTDMQRYDQEILSYLSGVDTVILSVSPTQESSPFLGRGYSHLTLSQAEDFASRLGAKQLILTHISHCLQKELDGDHHKICAYDGMEVPLCIEG
ncbi:MBL fold metallo-hydrolase [Chlamydia gallinacea]|uniref:Hydrolase n=2 Tax=Chlamydia gallinacea TaxID=1457153 RepID=A0A173DZG1_9CHLA|nr:MBL fold metallo-hydrolase [Chlamydia gallinacea]EYE61867.1 metallo-beta-lactamase superfamily protein [Bacteroides fragilis str. S6L5]ANG66322.1 hydrolase [Chlamydia gallinacea 08-1274/3]AQT77473.1 MBL fold hydrolase [Chlamydia gallinacea]MBX6679781.1 MBL fold metallo-hydrolase [Chlamydia gallinacea]MBX6687711.1 MBL fold metallo-hydrolase [Chlamydia gallinacea]